jgi:hypothetical protein
MREGGSQSLDFCQKGPIFLAHIDRRKCRKIRSEMSCDAAMQLPVPRGTLIPVMPGTLIPAAFAPHRAATRMHFVMRDGVLARTLAGTRA